MQVFGTYFFFYRSRVAPQGWAGILIFRLISLLREGRHGRVCTITGNDKVWESFPTFWVPQNQSVLAFSAIDDIIAFNYIFMEGTKT